MNSQVPCSANKVRRDPILDVAKGLGMLLIVIAHINYTEAPLTYIYSFHVPLFFILSGFLFRREKYETFGQFFKQRLRTLICPYVVFYLFGLLVKAAVVVYEYGISGLWGAEFMQAVAQMVLAVGASGFANNPLWFVLCLFCTEMIYYLLSGRDKWFCAVICVILVCIGWQGKVLFSPFRLHKLPWKLDISLFVIGFYALGNLLAPWVRELLAYCKGHPRKVLLCGAAALFCFVMVGHFAMWNGKVSVGSGVYENGLLLYISGVLGTLGVLFLSVLLQNCRFLQFLGKNTFPMMGTHYVIRNVMNMACMLLGIPRYNTESVAESILPFVLVMAASVACTMLYNAAKNKLKKSPS